MWGDNIFLAVSTRTHWKSWTHAPSTFLPSFLYLPLFFFIVISFVIYIYLFFFFFLKNYFLSCWTSLFCVCVVGFHLVSVQMSTSRHTKRASLVFIFTFMLRFLILFFLTWKKHSRFFFSKSVFNLSFYFFCDVSVSRFLSDRIDLLTGRNSFNLLLPFIFYFGFWLFWLRDISDRLHLLCVCVCGHTVHRHRLINKKKKNNNRNVSIASLEWLLRLGTARQ